jgi:hypothetical protein
MRCLRYFLLLAFFTFAFPTAAQEQILTDAQRDDLAGPVRSVSTSITSSGIQWRQPDGPSLVATVPSRDCEYDFDGSRTKVGQTVDGIFRGQTIWLVRDANEHVTDRLVTDAVTQQLESHDVMGPFGKTEQTTYMHGKPDVRQTFGYDQYGHFSDLITFDAAGNQQAHLHISSEKDGTITERWTRAKNGQLGWEQTFDPETLVEHLTTFDEFGKVKLAWTVSRGNLISFWEPSDSPSQPWDNFNEYLGDNDVDNYACQNDGKCEVSHVHYEYVDSGKHNLRSAEWRGADGQLRFAAYYKYEMDRLTNWTYREVWVWTPELGERTLYETDFRTITYWRK